MSQIINTVTITQVRPKDNKDPHKHFDVRWTQVAPASKGFRNDSADTRTVRQVSSLSEVQAVAEACSIINIWDDPKPRKQ